MRLAEAVPRSIGEGRGGDIAIICSLLLFVHCYYLFQ